MKSIQKSTFHKLFLIEAETYHKILPLLNKMERQELLNLNEDYKDENEIDTQQLNKDPLNSNSDENVMESNQQITEDSIISLDKGAKDQPQVTYSNFSTPEELEAPNSMPLPLPTQSTVGIQNSAIPTTRILKQSIQQKKPKKYLCGYCNKGFTTKFSLKRHNNTFHSPTKQNQEDKVNHERLYEENPKYRKTLKIRGIKRTFQEVPENPRDRGVKRPFQEETDGIDDGHAFSGNVPRIGGTKRIQTIPSTNDSTSVQNEDNEIEVGQKPVRISKYSNRFLKRKYQQAPETSDEENAYQKMPRIRGIKRTATTQTTDDDADATDIKQMRYEAGLTEADFLAPRGIKRQIKRAVDSKPNKKLRWVNF